MIGCRGCGKAALSRVVNLGKVPAADFFPPATDPVRADEASHALAMDLCRVCGLAQLAEDDTVTDEPRGVEPQALKDHAKAAIERSARRVGCMVIAANGRDHPLICREAVGAMRVARIKSSHVDNAGRPARRRVQPLRVHNCHSLVNIRDAGPPSPRGEFLPDDEHDTQERTRTAAFVGEKSVSSRIAAQ
jgi:Putative zinc binding domain